MATNVTFREVERWIKSNANEEQCVMLASHCAMRIGWLICIEEGQEIIRGLTMGTEEYVDKYFKEDR